MSIFCASTDTHILHVHRYLKRWNHFPITYPTVKPNWKRILKTNDTDVPPGLFFTASGNHATSCIAGNLDNCFSYLQQLEAMLKHKILWVSHQWKPNINKLFTARLESWWKLQVISASFRKLHFGLFKSVTKWKPQYFILMQIDNIFSK